MHLNTVAAEVIARLTAEPGGGLTVSELVQLCARPAAEVRGACELLVGWGILGVTDDGRMFLTGDHAAQHLPFVLVVENNPAVAHVVGALLESEGYRVLIANSLAVGLGVVGRLQPSLVLADSFAATAKQALTRLGELRDSSRPAPVLIFTAHRDVDDATAREAGYAGLLPKPFDIDELLARVAEAI